MNDKELTELSNAVLALQIVSNSDIKGEVHPSVRMACETLFLTVGIHPPVVTMNTRSEPEPPEAA